MKTLALLAGLLFVGDAFSETYLTVPFASYHLGTDQQKKHYNESNIGLGLEHAISPDWSIAAGFYRNSLYRESGYAGATYAPLKLGQARIGAAMGFVTGYASKPLPVLAPAMLLGTKDIGLNVVLIPPVGSKTPAVIALQLKWRLD